MVTAAFERQHGSDVHSSLKDVYGHDLNVCETVKPSKTACEANFVHRYLFDLFESMSQYRKPNVFLLHNLQQNLTPILRKSAACKRFEDSLI